MEKETLTGDEFRTMLAKYVTIPEENLAAVQMAKMNIMADQPAVAAMETIDVEVL